MILKKSLGQSPCPSYTFTSQQKKNCQLHISSLICNLILGKTSFYLRVSGNFIVQSTNKCHSVEFPSIPKFFNQLSRYIFDKSTFFSLYCIHGLDWSLLYIFVLIFEYTLFKNFMLDLYIRSFNKLSQKLFLTNIKMAKVFQRLEPRPFISSVSFFPPNWSLLRINIKGSLNWTWWFHVSHDTIWRMSDYMMKTMFFCVNSIHNPFVNSELITLSIQRNGCSMCHILPQNN